MSSGEPRREIVERVKEVWRGVGARKLGLMEREEGLRVVDREAAVPALEEPEVAALAAGAEPVIVGSERD
jgi:hypothetical protein